MASVRQIAARAGTSVATVSRALNDKPNVSPVMRERVLSAARDLGYSPTDSSTSTVVALAYPEEIVHAEYGAFDSAVLSGVLRGLEPHKYDVVLLSIKRDKRPDQTYTEFFRSKGIAGAILRSFEGSGRVCETIAREGFPSIVIADRFEDPSVNFVCTSSRENSQKAIEHLIKLGHRRIALAVHHRGDTDHRDRREGYRDAHRAHGLEIDPSLEVEIIADMRGGGNCIRHLMGLAEPPTGVYFTDPISTLGALHACREMQIRVPEDLSVIGFDDSDVRHHAFPPYTSVCQDATMLGFDAARWLIRCLSERTDEPLRLIRPTTFEINQTTSTPRSSRNVIEPGEGSVT